jgi:hypothetical protein
MPFVKLIEWGGFARSLMLFPLVVKRDDEVGQSETRTERRDDGESE